MENREGQNPIVPIEITAGESELNRDEVKIGVAALKEKYVQAVSDLDMDKYGDKEELLRKSIRLIETTLNSGSGIDAEALLDEIIVGQKERLELYHERAVVPEYKKTNAQDIEAVEVALSSFQLVKQFAGEMKKDKSRSGVEILEGVLGS